VELFGTWSFVKKQIGNISNAMVLLWKKNYILICKFFSYISNYALSVFTFVNNELPKTWN